MDKLGQSDNHVCIRRTKTRKLGCGPNPHLKLSPSSFCIASMFSRLGKVIGLSRPTGERPTQADNLLMNDDAVSSYTSSLEVGTYITSPFLSP